MEIFDFIMIFLAPAIFCIISVQISHWDGCCWLVRLLLMTIESAWIICGGVHGGDARRREPRPRIWKAMGKPVYGVRYRGTPSLRFYLD